VVKLAPSLASRIRYTTHTSDTNKTTQLILNEDNETIFSIPPDAVDRQRIPATPEHEAVVTDSVVQIKLLT
jgi:hypothetical protein